MTTGPETVFRFAAEGVDLEFAGSEEFVEKQLARFQAFLKGAVGTPTAEASTASVTAPTPAEAPATATLPHESLDDVLRGAPHARGPRRDPGPDPALHLLPAEGPGEARGLGRGHRVVLPAAGHLEPKNLHNALGILKRKIGHLQEGTKRGLMPLSPDGTTYVEGRFRGR